MSDNVLIIGSGGREHCLAWKFAQSEHVQKVYVAPGNGGSCQDYNNFTDKIENAASVNVADHSTVKSFCSEANVDLVIIGPEAPLAAGIVDYLSKHGIPCFGPTKRAAKIETSKAFAKDFMMRHSIPTARYQSFTDCELACKHIRTVGYPALVVKASGLAAGKGVIVAENSDEAEKAVVNILQNNAFGEAGNTIVIEEKLDGTEISVLAFSDGKNIAVMPPAQDYKRAYDGDMGPNTGGMGAYAPCSELSEAELQYIVDNVLQKAVDGMKLEECPFVGVLFAGIMLTSQGPKVLEFNCRFGDPETQVILPLMKSDLYATIMEAVSGDLPSAIPSWHRDKAAVGVVMTSAGYPGSYQKGYPITGTEKFKESEDMVVFHAGTRFDPESKQLLTAGGRVLCTVAVASTLQDAQRKAYEAVQQITFENVHYRKDIADKAFRKLKMTYSVAGVNIDTGNRLVEEIKPLAKATLRSGCLGDLGGFGGMFDLKAVGYQDPILVSGTDGVGTKLKIAQSCGLHSTVGIDLVAMCVNDILAHGAEPLYFLDYFATGKLEVSVAKQVVEGVTNGCTMAGCALLGGETAEMPGMYSSGEYDLAGFAVGAVERSSILPKKNLITPGDVIIGLASSGLHSNGYSLVRKVLDVHGLAFDSPCPFNNARSMGEVLMTPTKIYVKSVLPLMKAGKVKAFVHVTGGGLLENIPRVLPECLGVSLDASLWNIPPVFGWISQAGNIEPNEMLRTFNCGLGAVLICANEDSLPVLKHLQDHSEQASIIGVVQESSVPVVVDAFLEKLRASCCAQSMMVNGVRHKKRSRVGVLISGSGTNLQALINHAAKPESSAEIVIVISNVDGVQGLTRAKNAGIPTAVIKHKNFSSRTEFDMALDTALHNADVEFVCLAGFMRILTGGFVNKWRGRMLNTHPSLLPSFKGMHAHRDVLNAGVKVSGCTVHFVAEEVDAGAIVAQEAVPVLPKDTVESLQERVKKAEHICYPKAMELLASGRIVLGDDGRVHYQW